MKYRALPTALVVLAACGGAPQPAPSVQAEPVPTPTPPVPTPPVQAPAAAAKAPISTHLQGGLSVQIHRGSDPSGFAELEFGFLGGASDGKPGTADLAAETLLALGDSTTGRPPLRQRLLDLGGGAQAAVGPGSIWLSLRVPEARLGEALVALRAAVDAGMPSRAPLEHLRNDLVRRRLHELAADPIGLIARRKLLGDLDPAEHLGSLQDRDPTDIVLFLQRQCRPENAVLAVRTGNDTGLVARAIAATLDSWKLLPLPAAPPRTTAPPPLRTGLYWAPSSATVCRAALLVPLLPSNHGHALRQQVLIACLSLEGLGGRFERMLDAAGLPALPLRVRQFDQVESRAMLLETELAPEQVVTFWRTAQNAMRSLQQTPPSASELALATDRARLTAFRDDDGAPAALRKRAVRGDTDDQVLQQLGTPPANDAQLLAAIDSLVQLPLCMLVIGADPPGGLGKDLIPIRLPPPDTLQRLFNDPTGIAAAKAELEAALQAAGGRQRLLRITGYHGIADLRGEGAAPVKEELEWRPGRLQRKLKVLGSCIETTVDSERQVEVSGGSERHLRPREAEFLRQAAARHPLMLLATFARGELQSRLVAVRQIQGRATAILEVEASGSERLRLHIDRDSHLLRTVESWGSDPDGTPRYVQESWSDYQSTSGVRVPWRRLCDVDDGQSRVEAVWTAFTPLAAG